MLPSSPLKSNPPFHQQVEASDGEQGLGASPSLLLRSANEHYSPRNPASTTSRMMRLEPTSFWMAGEARSGGPRRRGSRPRAAAPRAGYAGLDPPTPAIDD